MARVCGTHNAGYLHFIVLIAFLLLRGGVADDSEVILQLAKSLTPIPSGWSTTSGDGYCSWNGISCDRKSVTSINLSNRKISGSLPAELGKLTSLKTLSVQGNSLSGAVPSLASLSSLEEVFFDNNNFTSFPDDFFNGMTGLAVFSINQNPSMSSWSIPLGLKEASGLTKFFASASGLVGTIPDIFTSFASLTDLKLSYNNLTGGLPPSFGNSQIKNLWLNNQVSGLSGFIDVLASMPAISQVWLQKNSFNGPIPNLSKCTSLFDLQLRDNALTGQVPDTLINLPSLSNISLANNKFQGRMPKFPDSVKVDDDGLNDYCLTTPGVACDPQVTALIEVAAGFGYPGKLADSWKGNDACTDWGFITCVGKDVTVVNLGKQHFGGIISPAFGNISSLKSLRLNDNNLTGVIPSSLTKLTSLQSLDVSNNNLSGEVPTFAKSVVLVVSGNPYIGKDVQTTSGGSSSGSDLTNSGSSDNSSGAKGKGMSGGLVAGIVVAIVAAVLVLVTFVIVKHRIKKRRTHSTGAKTHLNGHGSEVHHAKCCNNGYGVLSDAQSTNSANGSSPHIFEGGNVVISIEVLRQVTHNFSETNVLGKGGFGVVYKGELHDGTKIAVKRMEASQLGSKGNSEFQAEIGVLTKVRHRHLVALLGYCINGMERLLVYEYMPQGTLAQHLFEWRDLKWPPLTWKQRVTIALDVARGVEYLHSLAQQSFIHRDLKPSNILLGDDMRAKVADFGLVKLAPDGKYSMETRLAGTFGYLAPEYAATGRVTVKVDVYAFGVILMEIITGRKALDDSVPDERAHLVAWFRRVIINRENIKKSLDPELDPDEETLASILKVAELAGHCTAREPYQRPVMGHAVNVLGPLVEVWRPTSQDDDHSGIDLHMSLPECLERWQANEGTSTMFDNTTSRSSIPDGLTSTFTSSDGR